MRVVNIIWSRVLLVKLEVVRNCAHFMNLENA